MQPALSEAFHFADFQGFAALRRAAGDDTPEARRAVAQQFEAMFLNQLLSQMREAGQVEGGLFDAESLRPYQSMHDQQLALTLSQGRGIGLAEAILRQFGDTPVPAAPRPDVARDAASGLRTESRSTGRPALGAFGSTARAADAARPRSPEQFVREVWPHAERAGARLGVAPEVLVAQAALETGWGRSQITYPDGRPSFNLFGIKATGSWSGARVAVPTLEFVNGVPERRREQFRAYAGLEQGFADYVRLVSGHDRYRAAVEADTGEGYLRGLQAGGYATDPAYADKILAILQRGLPGRTPAVEPQQPGPGAKDLAAAADTDFRGTSELPVRRVSLQL